MSTYHLHLASKLVEAYDLFETEPERAMDLYAEIEPLVTDENRFEVAKYLKACGSKIEVLSSGESLVYTA